MHSPPPPIHTACLRAAIATTVPVSLLEALAFVASTYNPAAEGPARGNAGAPGKGLFLLGPRVLEQLKVQDPYDAAQNARAAADVLRALGDRYQWAEDSMVIGFIWGGAKLSRLLATPIEKRAPLPFEVKEKLDQTAAARRWLLRRAQPVGSDAFERLRNAIVGAAAANASWPPAQQLVRDWGAWSTAAAAWTVPQRLADKGFAKLLQQYDSNYWRLPVTDSRTPPPETIGASTPPQALDFDGKPRAAPSTGSGWGALVLLLLAASVRMRRR